MKNKPPDRHSAGGAAVAASLPRSAARHSPSRRCTDAATSFAALSDSRAARRDFVGERSRHADAIVVQLDQRGDVGSGGAPGSRQGLNQVLVAGRLEAQGLGELTVDPRERKVAKVLAGGRRRLAVGESPRRPASGAMDFAHQHQR